MTEDRRVLSFGCRLNIYESEVIKRHLPDGSDTLVVNTCAVTAEAERQARQAIRRAHRQNPDADGEEYQEIFADKLTTKQQADGYVAWTEQIHLHLFYQRIVETKDMKIKPTGRHITPLRRAAIRKAGPLVAP